MKKIMVIAPHSDDEILGMGGTIAKNIAEGNEVYVCIVTQGFSPLFPEEIVDVVKNEARNAHQYLGVKDTFFLEMPAAQLENVERYKLNDSIIHKIMEIKPNEVYIPHVGDMQKDHQLVAEAAMVALRPKYEHKVSAVYAYETLSETEWNIPNVSNAFIPNRYVDISGEFLEKKLTALKSYKSQVADFPNPRSLKAVEALANYRGSTVCTHAAEAFYLIREIC